MKVYLIIHLIISCLIGLLGYKKINGQERFANFILAIFFPIGGYLMAITLYFTRHLKSKKEIKRDEEIRVETLFSDRIKKGEEQEVASLEEILILNNNETKRRQVMNLLTDDASQYLQTLKIAMRDDDVETSHYAAAAIADIKGNLEKKLQDYLVKYEENKEDRVIANGYLEILKEYIDSDLLDEINQKKYQYIYANVLEEMIKIFRDNEVLYTALIDELFELKEFKDVRKYALEFLEVHRNENAYFSVLKVDYVSKDKPSFQKTFQALLDSDVKLSKEGLEKLRFWLKVMK